MSTARMHLKLWGTRGSLPAPLAPEIINRRIVDAIRKSQALEFKTKSEIESFIRTLPFEKAAGFGGDTSCAEVGAGKTQVIIDCGSGIRSLGYEMLGGPAGKGKAEIHIVMTHFHWDHVIGLCFFAPIFIRGNIIHFHAVQPELEDVVRLMFRKPMFPVPFEKLGATIRFHSIPPREDFTIGDLTITAYQLDHPDPCWGFKFRYEDKSLAYCVDTEAIRFSKKELGDDYPLYQNNDLMVFDAQYTLMETVEKVNWGHAAGTLGLDIAIREKIPRVLFVHHDPAATDHKIALAAKQVRDYEKTQRKSARRNKEDFFNVDWLFVRDGYETDI